MTEQLHFHFSLSCIGEGNGNPLQCSCLENPKNGGAWWTAVYEVVQSWTRLKWLSSSSSSRGLWDYPQFFSFFLLYSALQKLFPPFYLSAYWFVLLLQIFCYWFLLELFLISVIILFVCVYLSFNSSRSLLIDSWIFSVLFATVSSFFCFTNSAIGSF